MEGGEDRERRGRASKETRDRSPLRKRNRVFVSNVPYEYRWTDLKDLFRKHVGDVEYVELYNDERDKPRGCGVVELSSEDGVRRALDVMHRFPIDGRKLVVREELDDERPRRGHSSDGGGGAGGGGGGGGGPRGNFAERSNSRNRSNNNNNNNSNIGGGGGGTGERAETYGLSIQFLESIGVGAPLVNKVFVANLDYKVDAAKLKEIFKMAGKVRLIDLSTDKEGNSRGFAVIVYDHPVEAVQAISMFDKQILYDRKLTVRMDRVNSEKSEVRLPEGLKGIGVGLGPNGEPLRDVARHVSQNMSGGGAGSASTIASQGSILGAVPPSVAMGGLNVSNVGNSFGMNTIGANLGLQALGLGNLNSLQAQLLQQNLTNADLGLSSSAMGGGIQDLNSSQIQNGLMAGGNMSSSNLMAGGNMSSGNMAGGNMGSGHMLSANMVSGNMSSGNMGSSNMISSSMSGGNMGSSNMTGFNRSSGLTQSSNYNSPMNASRQMTGNNFFNNQNLTANSSPSPFGRDASMNDDFQKKSSETIKISNLPTTMTWQLVREKFSEAGDIKFADKTGKDTAIVRYQNEWSAARAVKTFDKTRIDGRTIDVRFC